MIPRALALTFALVACADGPLDDPADPDGPAAPWIELGVGRSHFEALPPGADLPIIAGHQGAYHVLLSLRGEGFDATGVRVDFSLSQAGQPVGGASYTDTWVRGPSGTYEYLSAVVFFDSTQPARVADRVTEISVQLRDRRGLQLEDGRAVMPRWRR